MTGIRLSGASATRETREDTEWNPIESTRMEENGKEGQRGCRRAHAHKAEVNSGTHHTRHHWSAETRKAPPEIQRFITASYECALEELSRGGGGGREVVMSEHLRFTASGALSG